MGEPVDPVQLVFDLLAWVQQNVLLFISDTLKNALGWSADPVDIALLFGIVSALLLLYKFRNWLQHAWAYVIVILGLTIIYVLCRIVGVFG